MYKYVRMYVYTIYGCTLRTYVDTCKYCTVELVNPTTSGPCEMCQTNKVVDELGYYVRM